MNIESVSRYFVGINESGSHLVLLESNYLGNFGKEHFEEHFLEIILKLDQ